MNADRTTDPSRLTPTTYLCYVEDALRQRLLWSMIAVVSVVLIAAVLCLLIVKRKT